MANTTLTQVDPAISTYYDRVLLVRALPELVHHYFGQQRSIPLNSGNYIKFRRYTSLTAATAPLSEGVTPAAVQLSKTDITAQLFQYGNYVQITDMVEWTNQDPVLTETGELLGENAGNSLDQVDRDALVGGTSVMYEQTTPATTRATCAGILTNEELDKVTRALGNNNAKKFTKMINPANKYASSPIRACFWSIVHPDTYYDLDSSVTDFIPVHEYSAKQDTYPQEIGSYKHIRFVESTNAKVFTSSGAAVSGAFQTTDSVSNDVYATLVFAQNAYGISKLSGKGLENIRKPRGSGTDYLDQYSTSGWKATRCPAKILDDNFMYRIEHCATI